MPVRPLRRLTAPATACVLYALCALASAAASTVRDGGKGPPVYKWTDEKGVVHYGDAVPPQYAEQDKTVLNSQGVAVGTIPGRRTPEQLAAEAASRQAEDSARQGAVLARQRDTNLLATYLTVEEIESLRDRRVDILEAQGKVTTQYLDQLRAKQHQLEQQAQKFRPYSSATGALLLPERLAEDLVRVHADMQTQLRNLEVKRQETAKLKEQFGRDILRFRELKKIEAEYARSTQPR